MDNLERKIKRQINRAVVKNAVLGTFAAAGIITTALAAPGILKLLKIGNIEKSLLRRKKQAIYNAIDRLKAGGLLVEHKKDDRKYIAITEKGKRYFSALQGLSRKKIKWDRKWRVVIFDIEEKYRSVREKVRRELVNYGFHKLQNSVWIYPYPCEEYVALLKSDNKTGRHLLYMIVDEIESPQKIKEFFGLS